MTVLGPHAEGGLEIPRFPRTVLIVHNRYQQRGGEDTVVEAEADLLRRNGHEVRTLIVSNDQIDPAAGIARKVRLGARTVWSERSKRLMTGSIRRHRPDLVHVHNTFPLLSPSIYSACREAGVPVVQTLHNFRLICPVATLFRDHHPCEECVGKTVPWPGVVHACYRDSAAATAPVAAMLAYNNLRRTWHKDVDLFLVLSNFGRDLFIRGGLPANRLLVQSNFAPDPPGTADEGGEGFVFVGRLSEEKGLRTLLDAWLGLGGDGRLTVAGDGPLRPVLEEAIRMGESISALGRISREAASQLMRRSAAVIVPSICYEGHPLAILEAFSEGRPVIASRLGSMAELIDDGRTGLLFTPGDPDSLRRTVRTAMDDPGRLREMGRAARAEYDQRFTEAVRYRQLLVAYRMARRRAGRRRLQRAGASPWGLRPLNALRSRSVSS